MAANPRPEARLNPAQQRQHRTVTEALAQQIADLQLVVEALAHNGEVMKRAALAQAEQIGRLEAWRSEHHARLKELEDYNSHTTAFFDRPFIQRLRWILVGR